MYFGKKQQKPYKGILLTHKPKPGETKVSRSRVTHWSYSRRRRRRPSASLSRRRKARVALSTLESGRLELKTVFQFVLTSALSDVILPPDEFFEFWRQA